MDGKHKAGGTPKHSSTFFAPLLREPLLWQHVRDDPTATPPVWYYCPQHAQEAVARLGLAWPA